METMIREKEAERILKYIREDAYVVTLEIKGKQLTSGRTGREDRPPGHTGEESHSICDRRLNWPGRAGAE